MKMPRNPIRGDLTSREDAEYAIPFHHSIMLKLEEQKYVYEEPPAPTKLLPYIDDRTSTFARSNPQVEDVRRRIQTVKQPHLETLRNRFSANESIVLITIIENIKRMKSYSIIYWSLFVNFFCNSNTNIVSINIFTLKLDLNYTCYHI